MVPTTKTYVRIAEFDGLRGLAIGLVMWHHLIEAYLPAGRDSWLGWLRAATNLTWCGVDLFFVLSGFFIGGILLDHRTSPRLARVFYLRRAFRILPLYYLTLAVILALHALGWAWSGPAFPAWVYALFLTNFYLAAHQAWEWLPLAVLWSLAIEEQFYLTAPWVVRTLKPAMIPRFLPGLVLTAFLMRAAAMGLWPGNRFVVHVLMPMRMDALALGALVAWALRQESAGHLWVHLRRHWSRWLAAGLSLLAGLTLLRPLEGGGLLALGGYPLLSGIFALLVAIVAGVRPPPMNRLLAWRPLALLGRHSYFLYLWHGLIGVGLIRWWGGENFLLNSVSALPVVIGAAGATWLAAAISWKFFEAPLVRWSRRYSY